jgi:1-acyl-sn-glycerol-3-phosphate acyltransferase
MLQYSLISIVFYNLLKAYARLAVHLYCTKIVVNKKEVLKIKGPVLFAANHPNSFLDGVILSTLLDENLYSLTRGDVFKNKTAGKILSWLKLLPVYRTSEGTQNLVSNYTTFSACHNIFEKKKNVLIFSEACCINEWHLRPLRKGTARLAFSSWHQGIDLKVIPLAFNYSSFKKFGKEVHLSFGEEINRENFNADTDGKLLTDFTQQLYRQLQPLVYEAKDENEAQKLFFLKESNLKKALLLLPGLLGWVLHAPLFYLCKVITESRFKKNDHYDGVLVALLFFSYPFYLLLLSIVTGSYHLYTGLFVLVILPFLAWCWLQVKNLFERSSITNKK